MPLTVLDIANKEFKTSLRGYNQDEVDEFLDEVMRDYEALLRENEELRQNTAGMGEKLEQYRALEQTLQNTLVVAQSTADEMKQAARKEAELVVREAEQRARELIQRAEADVERQRAELERLRRETDQFRAQVKSLLESQLAILNRDLSVPAVQETRPLESSRGSVGSL
ncbi:MAG: DivIVA domain-containing protein [Firmicutes bacterium]|nr:DivIVA domain-containing protein [Bacillota bacterium]